MNRLMQFSAGRRGAALVILAVLTAVMATGLPKVTFDTAISLLISDSSPDKRRYDEVTEIFGSDNTTVIYVEDEDLFTPGHIARLRELVDDIAVLDTVERVDSLFSVSNVRDEDNALETGPTIAELPDTVAEAERQRDIARANPLLVGNYISADRPAMAINVRVRVAEDTSEDVTARSHEQIGKLLEPLRGEYDDLFQIGRARIAYEMERGMSRDMVVLGGLAVIALAFSVLVFLRNPGFALLPLITSAVSVIWTFGFMGWIGIPVTLLTSMLPALLLVIGSTEDVHLVSAYLEGLDEHPEGGRAGAVAAMARRMSTPVLITSGTTAVGFLAMLVSDTVILHQFAIASSAGILFNIFITALLLPMLLRTFGPRRPARGDATAVTGSGHGDGPSAGGSPGSGRIGDWIGQTVVRVGREHRRVVVAAFIVVAVGAVASMPRLGVNNDPLGFFHDDAPIVDDTRKLHETLSGAQTFFITLDTPDGSGRFDSAELLQASANVVDVVQDDDRFDSTMSLAQLMRLLHREMRADPDAFTVPDKDSLIEQFLLFFQRSDIERYINPDHSMANIVVRHNLTESTEANRAIADLRDRVDRVLAGRGVQADFVGLELMVNEAADDLILSQFWALLLVLVTVFGVMSLLFMSLRAGLLSLIPNLFPILVAYGGLALLGVPLTISTAIVAALAIGVAVDDTMHMLIRYSNECRNTDDDDLAVARTMRSQAMPVVSSTLALGAAFALFAFSEFSIIVTFGLMAATAMVTAMLTDLLLMPLILRHTRPIGLWQVLSLRVGEDVLSNSPLLRGMSRWQMKKLILLSELRELPAGSDLIEQGAEGEEMYLLLEGQAEVRVTGRDGQSRRVSEIQPGAIVGEVAFVDRCARTATVRAETDISVLVFTQEATQRRLRHYPYISLNLFRNISRVLGQRLAGTLGQVG